VRQKQPLSAAKRAIWISAWLSSARMAATSHKVRPELVRRCDGMLAL